MFLLGMIFGFCIGVIIADRYYHRVMDLMIDKITEIINQEVDLETRKRLHNALLIKIGEQK